MEENQNQNQEVHVQPIENIVRSEDGHLFTTSLIVSKTFEKEHKDVLKAISNLECSEEFTSAIFAR